MSDYLSHLVGRQLSPEAGVRPRIASLFAPEAQTVEARAEVPASMGETSPAARPEAPSAPASEPWSAVGRALATPGAQATPVPTLTVQRKATTDAVMPQTLEGAPAVVAGPVAAEPGAVVTAARSVGPVRPAGPGARSDPRLESALEQPASTRGAPTPGRASAPGVGDVSRSVESPPATGGPLAATRGGVRAALAEALTGARDEVHTAPPLPSAGDTPRAPTGRPLPGARDDGAAPMGRPLPAEVSPASMRGGTAQEPAARPTSAVAMARALAAALEADVPASSPSATAPRASPGARVQASQPGTTDSAPAAPVIQVTIGRIEVRAVTPPAPSRNAPARPAPVPSLDDYLKRRNGGER